MTNITLTDEKIKNIFWERVDIIRRVKKISLSEIGRNVGLSQSAMSLAVSEKRTVSLFKAYEISRFLNVSLDYLLGVSVNPAITPITKNKKYEKGDKYRSILNQLTENTFLSDDKFKTLVDIIPVLFRDRGTKAVNKAIEQLESRQATQDEIVFDDLSKLK